MKKRLTIFVLIALYVHSSCVKDRNFDAPDSACTTDLIANATYAKVKNLYVDATIKIHEDIIIEGFVISSDKAGNFFSVLHFQDSPTNPSEGFRIEIDVRDSHLFYPVGSKILIKLKGLYLGKSKGVFKIGGVFTSFGNESVGRLPASIVDQHIFKSCDAISPIQPVLTSIADIKGKSGNTLVQLEGIEILEEELGQPYALEREETKHRLIDCDDHELILLNSGFSDFQSELLPEGNGSIVGVLLLENEDYQLVIRDINDIDFNQARCEDLMDEFTSTNVFLSELADPDNNSAARFVELYNSSSEALSLKGWSLRRYTNANIEVSSTIDFSGFVIKAQSTLVISPNAAEFENVYGFPPDLETGTNSPADTNGDDNLALVDPFGTIIDVFGVIGEDGSGTDHEFEDGRAVRNPEISKGNTVYTFKEWTIYNDTGGSGTINQPQSAPDDFTPGERN